MTTSMSLNTKEWKLILDWLAKCVIRLDAFIFCRTYICRLKTFTTYWYTIYEEPYFYQLLQLPVQVDVTSQGSLELKEPMLVVVLLKKEPVNSRMPSFLEAFWPGWKRPDSKRYTALPQECILAICHLVLVCCLKIFKSVTCTIDTTIHLHSNEHLTPC